MGIIGACALIFLFPPHKTLAATGVNQQINYQARLLDGTGATAPDGNYNVEFKIYQDGTGCVSSGTSPCGGTLKWTETRTGTNQVAVRNGYFSVQLGEVTPFASSVDWNQDTLWLSINIGGTGSSPTWDGEMLPFRRMAAAPYALNASQLSGMSANQFVQLAPGGAQTDSGTASSIFINKTGSGNLLELQNSGSDVATISNAGNIVAGKYNSDTLTSTALTLSGVSPVISASTLNTGLTVQANGSGTLTLGNTLSGTVNLGTANTATIGIGNTGAALTVESGTGTTALFNGNTAHTIQLGAGGTSTAQGVTIGSATNTPSTLTLQAGNGSSAITLQTGNNGTTTAGGIQIGNTAGAFSQTIAIGTNTTASSSTTISIGSTVAGVTTLQSAGGVAINTLGAANSVAYLCRNGSNIVSTCQTTVSGSAFVQNGNSFGATALLGTTDGNALAFETSGVNRLQLSASGANFVFQQATTVNVASATTGTVLDIQGGDATSGTNAGGNLVLKGGAGASTGASGSVLVKSNGTDATTTFGVQNSGGASLFNIDGSNTRVTIGATSAGATATILVLSNKNTSGDPTSIAGAMYYNSTSNTFRCDDGDRGWSDCSGVLKPNSRRSAYMIANGTSTAFDNNGDISTPGTTPTAVAATTTTPGQLDYATGTTSGSGNAVNGNANYNTSNNPDYQAYVTLTSTSTIRIWSGLTNQTTATMEAAANPAGNYAAFRFDTSVPDTNYQCITKDGTTQTITNSNVAPGTTGHKLEIVINNGTNVIFKIDGAIVCTNTTHLPSSSTLLSYENTVTTLTAAAAHIRVGWIYLDSTF